jgi:arginine-tRNA-protein transferase
LSLGKFSILAQIKIAKELEIPYKVNYMPFEILKNRASLKEDAIWEKYEL